MCGIVGIVGTNPVNQMLYDALQLLQHRGQDAAGIGTASGSMFHMHKGSGLARDVFRTRNMRSLHGHSGIAQVRYPTQGSAGNSAEAQPFYVNAPFGIMLAHNGNLTNADQLNDELFRVDRRHINTNSDSEVLLNVLAHELRFAAERQLSLDADAIFQAVAGVHKRVRGSYAVVVEIAGFGLLAFRDPFGIRPLCFGVMETDHGLDTMVASESVALDGLGFRFVRDVAPGEAVLVDLDGRFYSRQCAATASLNPCMFEFVYLARPDSVMDGVSVYGARLRLGEYLADEVRRKIPTGDIDVVMPIPDSSRPAALQLANKLGLDYREGFIKNRYIGRTFIMPGQAVRKKSVRQKLNAIGVEFKGKNVLLVDDSIVRGTTSEEIVQMARDAGARRVYFASSAPPVRYPNVYGIDMPTRSELIAAARTEDEIRHAIRADALVYQRLDDMRHAVTDCNPALTRFDTSCFDGIYITGDVTPAYLDRVERARLLPVESDEGSRSQLSLAIDNADA
jgi:amidophosphoribosyltransferase